MLIRIFLISFLISLPFWWGVNLLAEKLEDFFFWQEMATNPQILTAQLNQKIFEEELRSLKPIRNREVEDLKIEAESAISVLIDSQGRQKILFQKNSDKKLPIASLTKLMTAFVVLENYNLSQIVEISKGAVQEQGQFGNLKIGEIFTVEGLLYPLLMESSNDAAYALAEVIGLEAFVELMNLEAKDLPTVYTQGLENTYFVNPTGLDSEDPREPINYSTVEDLVKLTNHLLNNQPLIWEIFALSEFNLYSPDGVYHHKVSNTNELLGEIPEVIGGKTGWTTRARGCLLLVSRAPKNQGYLINVILGSENRFEEMRKLFDWVHKAYKW